MEVNWNGFLSYHRIRKSDVAIVALLQRSLKVVGNHEGKALNSKWIIRHQQEKIRKEEFQQFVLKEHARMLLAWSFVHPQGKMVSSTIDVAFSGIGSPITRRGRRRENQVRKLQGFFQEVPPSWKGYDEGRFFFLLPLVLMQVEFSGHVTFQREDSDHANARSWLFWTLFRTSKLRVARPCVSRATTCLPLPYSQEAGSG